MADEVSPEQAREEYEAPAPAASQEKAPEERVTDEEAYHERVPQPQPYVDPTPKEVHELEEVIKDLSALNATCDETLTVSESLVDQQAVQAALKEYSHTLPKLPKALQSLEDFRRHFPMIAAHAEDVRSRLVEVRGDEDAISSEEARIIVDCNSVAQTILESLNALEGIFSNVRLSTPTLLSMISYDKPGFASFAKGALKVIHLETINGVIDGEIDRLTGLKDDLLSLYGLDEHATELEKNVQPNEG